MVGSEEENGASEGVDAVAADVTACCWRVWRECEAPAVMIPGIGTDAEDEITGGGAASWVDGEDRGAPLGETRGESEGCSESWARVGVDGTLRMEFEWDISTPRAPLAADDL